jgi:hypothetical protein
MVMLAGLLYLQAGIGVTALRRAVPSTVRDTLRHLRAMSALPPKADIRRRDCYLASTRSREKRPPPVTKIATAPPMIEIFFRKLLYWPICCGPAGYSQ